MIKNTLQKIYLGLIFILLYAPIITLVVLSFNNSKTRAKWGGFTGKWYVALFQNEQIMNALYTTLIIALLSALIATLIGTAAAIGIQAMRKRVRTAMMAVTNIPMLNARYRDWNFLNALIYRIPLFTWICNDPHGTHYVQHSLCHLKCHAKIKADKPSDL